MATTPAKQESVPDPARASLRVLLGGMLGMAVAMGLGRFVFTPIIPLMQRDLGLTHGLAGWLAGLNYLGYLIGALLCSFMPQLARNRLVGLSALLVTIIGTALMALAQTGLVWGLLRLAAGIASALLFIIISVEVAEALGRRGHLPWIGALYGGIGFGIALSGSLVPLFDWGWGWQGAWIGSGLIAALLALIGMAIRRETAPPEGANAVAPPAGRLNRTLWPLAAAYFCEGLGYIVSATFLVSIIAETDGLAFFAPYSWVAVGLAAIPSTLFWPWLARRFGARLALLLAYGLQAAGILVCIWAESVPTVLFAAVSFGGTFLGIVALVMAEGGRRAPGSQQRIAAVLTACFGIGQILGPPIAGVLADLRHGFALPLLLAAGTVLVGALFIAIDRSFQKP
ncbi:MAG: YbfB/YjiJ family MFS transporter [Desulfuromonadales bacterium]